MNNDNDQIARLEAENEILREAMEGRSGVPGERKQRAFMALFSYKCPGCGEKKRAGFPFCLPCQKLVSNETRLLLRYKITSVFTRTFEAALAEIADHRTHQAVGEGVEATA